MKSLKRIPGEGKSGTSRSRPETSSASCAGRRSRSPRVCRSRRQRFDLGGRLGWLRGPAWTYLWTGRGAPGSSASAAPDLAPTPLGASVARRRSSGAPESSATGRGVGACLAT